MYPNIPQSSMGGSSYGTPMSQPYDNQSYQQQQPQQQPQQPWQVSGAQQNHSQNQYGGNQQQNQLMHSQQTQPQQQGYGQVPQQQQFQQSTSQNSPIPQNQQAGQSVLRRPAQIPTKANDEDPKYGPLGRARQAVQRGLIMDDEVTVDLLPAVQAASGQACESCTAPILCKCASGGYPHGPGRHGVISGRSRKGCRGIILT